MAPRAARDCIGLIEEVIHGSNQRRFIGFGTEHGGSNGRLAFLEEIFFDLDQLVGGFQGTFLFVSERYFRLSWIGLITAPGPLVF
jgi:hypothetical protein